MSKRGSHSAQVHFYTESESVHPKFKASPGQTTAEFLRAVATRLNWYADVLETENESPFCVHQALAAREEAL